MNDEGLLLCGASMLGLLVWRYWLAGQGAIRLRGNLVVGALVGAAGVSAVASRYLLGDALDAVAETNPAERASALADGLALAMNAGAAAMVCLAAAAVTLGALTFVHRRRDARR